MATVKIKLRPSSVEGKAGVIFYQITHNRKTQHITTRLRVQPFDWNADKEKLEPSAPNRSMIQNCIDCDVALLRSLISNLDTCRMNYSVNDIISRYKSPQNHILVLDYMRMQIEQLRTANRLGTAKNYEKTMCSFGEFLGDIKLPLPAMTEQVIAAYNVFLIRRGLVRNSVSFYISMTELELQQYLLREYPQENARCEWKEFKNLKNSFCGDEKNDVISYVSAIANMDGGDLVIGVHDKTLEIVGTDTYNYDKQKAILRLTERCVNLSTEDLYIDEFITDDTNRKVWVIHIPKHLPKRPVFAHNKAWQRIEDSLVEMTTERMSTILDEPIFSETDWSAQIVSDATIDDLDEVAIAKARMMFKKVHSRIPEAEVNAWTVETFLSKCGIMKNGGITRAAIILLGKYESAFKLRPAVVQVTWTRRDEKQDVVDYEHFTVPFILTVDEILSKIENLTMREMPGGTLFPDTMKQYDDYTIREALHNCIAHQDYTMQQRINFVENPTYLYYSNAGSFIPGTLENALTNEEPQAYFRNECLCRAMVDFNMIDTVSRGIKKMFNEQWRRHFPMPDYEIDAKNRKVSVRIYGNEINKQYTNLLKTNDSLTLWDCISLDAVQKGRTIHEDVAQNLLNRGLIEGEAPNYTISLGIAKATNQLQGYTKQKGLDKEKMKQMILQYLKNAGTDGAKRDSIYEYIKDVMPQVKTHEQQLRLLGDILSALSVDKLIYAKGRIWFLKE